MTLWLDGYFSASRAPTPSRDGGAVPDRPSGIEAPATLLIDLFRIWALARRRHDNPLPAMYRRIPDQMASPELATACQSLFELTEECLARRLRAASKPGEALSADENGLLALLGSAPQAGSHVSTADIPHGLPGALIWAAHAVLRALGASIDVPRPDPATPDRCPFPHDDPTRR